MSFFHSGRHLRTVLISLGLLALSGLLMGCGGSGGDSTTPASIYAGKSASAAKMTLGSRIADLQVTTAASGNVATGTLTLTDPSRATRLVIATPNCVGTYDPKTGALNMTGAYESPVGTRHTFSIVGTLPVAPSNKGSITVTLDGQAYGPFVFGDNTPATNGGNPGNNGGSGLTISGSTAPTTIVVNGPVTGVATASKFSTPFTINGVQYDGQYNVDITPTGSDVALEIFGLTIPAGQTFDFATPPRVNLTYLFITKNATYTADSGTLTVRALSASSITVSFTNVHLTPSPGTGAQSGGFLLNGSVTAPVTAQ